MPTRREFLRFGLPVALGLAGCTRAPTAGPPGPKETEIPPGDLPLQLETLTDQPTSPLAFKATPAGACYIADRPGRIYRLRENGIEIALDISDTVLRGGERGLLGLVLHPDFESNNTLYVRYSAPPSSSMPSSYSHTFVLAEFRTRADGTINPNSERVLLEIAEPQATHNSGPIAFGPDGYLYIGVGDGGGQWDSETGHVEDWYESIKGGNGQDITENLLGSLLRIDVDSRDDGKPYAIPEDNPLVGETGLDEHFAWGLRNPWGISFDGKNLYVADVGQARSEEVNLVEKGGNYGWNVREGTHCVRRDSCPTATPDEERLRDPIIEYPHPDTKKTDSDSPISGVAVVGGHIYRGNAVPALSGKYVFGDLAAEGQLFAATPAEEGLWPIETIEIAESSQDKLGQLFALGQDRDGELYALTNSGVHRLIPTT